MQENLRSIFAGKKVLIAGDIMLDSYIFGSVERISPEAPVPVVAIEKRENRPGGAANVAVNIKALGAEPLLCAIIGSDEEADIMTHILKNAAVDCAYLVQSQNRKTTAKIRVMAQKHQLLRLDYEQVDDVNDADNKLFIDAYTKAIQHADVVVLEDYNKGLLTAQNIPELIKIAKKHNVKIAVDPKKKNFWEYKGVDLFKPNLKELREALNATDNWQDESLFLKAVQTMQDALQNKISFITLSEKGVFIQSEKMHHFLPAFVRRIADVSGAGDTVISVAALCMAAGFDMKKTALIANLAGGLVCEEPGVVPINLEKLEAEYQNLKLQHEAI
jgi:rfaE bifunctional protein kinase chain/domain